MSIFPRRAPLATQVTLHIRVFLPPGVEPQLLDQVVRVRGPDGALVHSETGPCVAVAPERGESGGPRSVFCFGEPPLLSLSRPFEAPVVPDESIALWELLHGDGSGAPSDIELFSGLLGRSVSRAELHKLAFVLATMNLSTHRYLVVPASALGRPGRYTVEVELYHVSATRVQCVSVDDEFHCDQLELLEPAVPGKRGCVVRNPGPVSVPLTLLTCAEGDAPQLEPLELAAGEHALDCDPAALLRYCAGAALLPACPGLLRARRIVDAPAGRASELRVEDQRALRLANGLRAWECFVERVGEGTAQRLVALGLIAASPMESHV